MEFREVIVWIGLLAIVLIVWDGIRRMKLNGKPKPKKAVPEKYEDADDLKRKAEVARELPNGGARIREMTEDEKTNVTSKKINLRERVPMLMERVEVAKKEQLDDDIEKENEPTSTHAFQSELDFTAQGIRSGAKKPVENNLENSSDITLSSTNLDVEKAWEIDDQFNEGFSATAGELEQEEQSDDQLDDSDSINGASTDLTNDGDQKGDQDQQSQNSKVESSEAGYEEPNDEESSSVPVEDLVVIHVMAKKGDEFSGSLVLELLLRAGLRHGSMDIFHYRNPEGLNEFSMANCIQPGTFDPDSMSQLMLPGITLFMQLPSAADAMESFDHMYEMAQFLANHLNADILDEDHSSVTPQRIEYYREKLRVFARSKLIPS